LADTALTAQKQAIFEPLIHHRSFIKNVLSILLQTNTKIWSLKIREPFIFEAGSTDLERSSYALSFFSEQTFYPLEIMKY